MTELGHAGRPQLIVTPRPSELATRLEDAGIALGQPVIVLIGGATNMDGGDPDLEATVRDGVIATARDLGAVVVDGGTDAGVMGLAGRARVSIAPQLTLIGVAPLGKVHVDGVVGATGKTEIEPNHSYVLLINGPDWGSEVPWLIDSARAIAGTQTIVAVAVDGGQVAGIEANKVQAEGWPLITVNGSGRTADDLARIRGRGVQVVELSAGPAALAGAIKAAFGENKTQAVDFPPLYRAVSDASRQGQRRYRLLTLFGLILTLFGIGLGVVSFFAVPSGSGAGDPRNVAIAIATVGCFLLALILRLAGAPAGFDDDWRTGRSVAEGIKSQTWRYVMHVEPFDDDAHADARLAQTLQALMRRATEVRQAVDRLTPGKPQITDWMRTVRAQKLEQRKETYLRDRLDEQGGWYARKSASHRRSSFRLFVLTISAQIAAVACALLGLALLGDPGDFGSLLLKLMSFFGSAAIAVISWQEMNRHSELSSTYAYVFQELGLIADAMRASTKADQLERAVLSSEETISRENRAWMSKSAELVDVPDFGMVDN